MKYVKVVIDPIRLKADLDDLETLQHDLYEKIVSMVEAETLAYSIDEEEDNEDENEY